MAKNIFITLAVIFSAISIDAQINVYISNTSKDIVGSRLAYKIKENIRKSSGMQLVPAENESVIQIRMVTLDPGNNGNSTVYSVVWTITQLTNLSAKLYWTSSVGTCGSNRVDEVSESLVAQTDDIIDELLETVRSIMENNNSSGTINDQYK